MRQPGPAGRGAPRGGGTALADPSAVQLAALWRKVRDLVVEAQARFNELGAQTRAAPGYQEPRDLALDLLARLRQIAGLGRTEALRVALVWGMRERPRVVLFPVLLALLEREAGDPVQALAHARRAHRTHARHLLPQQLVAELEGSEDGADLATRFCKEPWESLETTPDGDVHMCCTAWLPTPIGNLRRQTPEEVWNGAAAQEIRRSILDGSYRYCSRAYCPQIANRKLPRKDALTNPEHRRIVRDGDVIARRKPRNAVLSHDRSCNLSCPSCRTELVVARKAEQDELDRLTRSWILPMLSEARRVKVTGSGDPFGSAHFRDVLLELARARPPGLRVTLNTNGLLFDERAWRELELEGLVDRAFVSIDAATPDTYRVLRRGGELDRLLENLAFVARLRRAGQLTEVRLDTVVQAANFRELPGIVQIARGFGFDRVKFQMIRNWGTFSAEQFARHHVGSPDHPEHAAFLEVLRDPLLAGPEVDFVAMNEALRRAGHPLARSR